MHFKCDMPSSCCADFVMGRHVVLPVADGKHGLLSVTLIASDVAPQSSRLPVVHLPTWRHALPETLHQALQVDMHQIAGGKRFNRYHELVSKLPWPGP